MSRYIDADKLWNDRPQLLGGESLGFKAGFSGCMWGFSERIKEQISHPTADVVEVVRCKDCIYNLNGSCTHSEIYDDLNYNPDYYCADGERKEE